MTSKCQPMDLTVNKHSMETCAVWNALSQEESRVRCVKHNFDIRENCWLGTTKYCKFRTKISDYNAAIFKGDMGKEMPEKVTICSTVSIKY